MRGAKNKQNRLQKINKYWLKIRVQIQFIKKKGKAGKQRIQAYEIVLFIFNRQSKLIQLNVLIMDLFDKKYDVIPLRLEM